MKETSLNISENIGEEATGDRYVAPFFGILILWGLYLIGLHNYLLFRNLTEMFGVILAFCIFAVAWNARMTIDNNYLLLLGISFLFVGGLDLLYVIAQIDMGVFRGYENGQLAARLRIMAEYMQSSSFLVAALFIGRNLRAPLTFLVYTVITAIFLLAVFHWQVPQGVPGVKGIEDFEKTSPIIVSVIFAGAIALLIYSRKDFDRSVLGLLLASLAAAICSEVAFLLSVKIGGPINLLRHFANIFSLCFVYAAVVQTGLRQSNNLLLYELERNESWLRGQTAGARKYPDITEVMIVTVGADGTVRLVNREAKGLLGYPDKEIVGKNWFDSFLPERIREKTRDIFAEMIKGELAPIVYHEDPVLTRGGEERVIAWHSAVTSDRNGNNIGTVSSGVDLTGRKKMEDMLKATQQKLKAITLALWEGVYIVDRMGRVVLMNREAENMLGWKEKELSGKNVHKLVHSHGTNPHVRRPEECPIMEEVSSGKVCRISEDVFIRKDGTPFPVTLVSTPILEDGVITGSVVAFRDITVRKRTEEALRRANELLARQATTDALTGIYNRVKFNGLFDMEIRKARRYKMPLALIMFDIDHFKAVNDRYGHQTGDSVLREIAGLVSQNIRNADLFGRWGGEEFMILVPENDLNNAFRLAEKLRMKIETHEFKDVGRATCSFGVTEFREEDTVVSLAGRADDALYAAKGNGRNRTECR